MRRAATKACRSAPEPDGSFVGVRAAGNEYPIADDQFVLDFFARIYWLQRLVFL